MKDISELQGETRIETHKIGSEAYRWAKAKVFNSNKTSVGRAIAFGCATRCHLSVHSLVMPRTGSDDVSRGGANLYFF